MTVSNYNSQINRVNIVEVLFVYVAVFFGCRNRHYMLYIIVCATNNLRGCFFFIFVDTVWGRTNQHINVRYYKALCIYWVFFFVVAYIYNAQGIFI